MIAHETEDTPTDPELWLRVVAGDGGAFHELYERYHYGLTSFLWARCPRSLSPDDVAQETWIRLWKQRQTAFDGREVRGWVFQTAKNILKDHFRKPRPEELPEEFDPIAADLQENEKIRHLADCLQELGDQFTAVIRAQLGGATVDEIAVQCGISTATVYTRVDRGKKNLKACVEGKLVN